MSILGPSHTFKTNKKSHNPSSFQFNAISDTTFFCCWPSEAIFPATAPKHSAVNSFMLCIDMLRPETNLPAPHSIKNIFQLTSSPIKTSSPWQSRWNHTNATIFHLLFPCCNLLRVLRAVLPATSTTKRKLERIKKKKKNAVYCKQQGNLTSFQEKNQIVPHWSPKNIKSDYTNVMTCLLFTRRLQIWCQDKVTLHKV